MLNSNPASFENSLHRLYDQDDMNDVNTKEFEAFLAQYPQDVETWLLAARVFKTWGDMDEVQKALDRARSIQANHPLIGAYEYLLHIDEEDSKVHKRYLERLAPLTLQHPENPFVQLWTGFAYAEIDDLKAATTYLTKAFDLRPHWRRNAEAYFRNLVALDQVNAALDLAARQRIPAPKYYNAIEYNFGFIFAENGHLEAALAMYDIAKKKDGAVNNVQHNRAGVLRDLGRYPEAIEEWSHLLQREPDWDWPLLGRGYCYYMLGDFSRAQADFAKAVKLDPDSVYARHHLALCLLELADQDAVRLQEGLQHVDAALRQSNTKPWYLAKLRLQFLMRLERWQEASVLGQEWATDLPDDEEIVRFLREHGLVSESYTFASNWRRVSAVAIDVSCIAVGWGLIYAVSQAMPINFWNSAWFLFILLFSLLIFIFPAVLDARSQSVGKHLMGLSVVNAYGQRLGYMTSIARQFLKFIIHLMAPLLLVFIENWLFGGRRLHDKIFNTYVVRGKPLTDTDASVTPPFVPQTRKKSADSFEQLHQEELAILQKQKPLASAQTHAPLGASGAAKVADKVIPNTSGIRPLARFVEAQQGSAMRVLYWLGIAGLVMLFGSIGISLYQDSQEDQKDPVRAALADAYDQTYDLRQALKKHWKKERALPTQLDEDLLKSAFSSATIDDQGQIVLQISQGPAANMRLVLKPKLNLLQSKIESYDCATPDTPAPQRPSRCRADFAAPAQ